MTAWIRQGMRLDVELAVALEVATLRLTQAVTGAERAAALTFNRTLWRSIHNLAATAPDMSDRDGLLAGAATVASADDPARVADCNTAHARILAAKSATQGGLKRMIEDWRHHRAQQPEAEFGHWLLSRMDGPGAPISV